MRRRYVYDVAADQVVEVGAVRGAGLSPRSRYDDVSGNYQYQFTRTADESAAAQLRHAALERADRREFAARRYGDERRWAD